MHEEHINTIQIVSLSLSSVRCFGKRLTSEMQWLGKEAWSPHRLVRDAINGSITYFELTSCGLLLN
jgi:hypothetical protein